MDVITRLNLIKAKPTEEILTEEDLRTLLEHGIKLKHYQGFEISGMVHLGTGLVSGLKIAQIQRAKVETTIFLADWHSWINDKLGSDLDIIQRVAKNYFGEAMKLCVKAMGGNPNAVNLVLGSQLYAKNPEYWETVIDIAKNTTLSRVRRSITILGRKMGEAIDFAKLIYPIMQVADIFALQVHIAHAGIDQRKAHVIAREVGKKIKFNQLKVKLGNDLLQIKPIAVHHSILMGLHLSERDIQALNEAEATDKEKLKDLLIDIKMSKSKPSTAIFVHDTPEEIKRKIRNAYCPPRQLKYNPIMSIAELLIFPLDKKLFIDRPAKFGGAVEYFSFNELKDDYVNGKLHPLDLKNAVADWLIKKLEPVREYFLKGRGVTALEELKNIRITR
ncbi:MAG: tyrosine--tRNA ligase [Candidatus Korarchaeota archaeon]|nr:tyrosine--tRNA ligase [Candidatus Korarchaeota archaeon]